MKTYIKQALVLLVASCLLTLPFGCGNIGSNSQNDINNLIYRGNDEHTGSYPGNSLAASSIKWKFFNHDQGLMLSAPLYWDGTVYFGSYDHNLYALDSQTGQVKWKFETSKPILSSTAISSTNILFGSMDGSFYDVDANTHELKWSFQSASFDNSQKGAIPNQGIRSAPVVDNGVVFFGCYGRRVYALDVGSGKEIWKYATENPVQNAPSVSDGIVYITDLDKLVALDEKTGVKKWASGSSGSPGSSPVVSNGTVLFADSFHLSAFNAQTGEIKWKIDASADSGLDVGPSVKDGVVFFGDNEGFHSVDLDKGSAKWNTPIPGGSTGSPPMIIDDSVYFVDSAAFIDRLDLNSGQIRSRFKLKDTFDPYWKTTTVMTPGDGVVFIADMDGNVYAIQ